MAEDVDSSLKLSTAVRNDGIRQVGKGLTHANQPGVAGKLSFGCTCLGRLNRVLHERVRRLAAGATLAPTGGGGGGEVPVAAPEAPRLCARLYPRGQRGNLAC